MHSLSTPFAVIVMATVATLSIAATPRVVSAQATTVRGTVIDRQTAAPVVGASVIVTGTSTGTLTNDAGAFTIDSPLPVARLTVTAVGYATLQIAVTDSEPLTIRLDPSHVELPGMHVVATRNAPSMATLTEADLQRAGGVALQNAINTVPGVFMQTRTPFGGARITMRGYYPSTSGNSPNANGLGYQVLLNDIPITDATGTTILDDVDYARLGRADLIKGPASSQYGSFIGGTVLFRTVRPVPGRTSIVQQVQSGSNGLLRTTTSLETATESSDAIVEYGHQEYGAFRPHSGSQKEFVHATGDVSLGDHQTLSAYFSYNRSFEELAGEIDSVPFYGRQSLSNAAYLANDSHIALTSFIAGVTDHYRFGSHFTNQTTVFATGRTSNQPFAHGFTDVSQVNGGARTVFGYTGRLGTATVTGSLGGLLQRSNLATNGVFIVPAPPYPERPTTQENWASTGSLFTEWSVGLPAQVTVTAGASVNANRFAIHNLLRNGQVVDTTTVMMKTFDNVITPRVVVSKGFGGAGSVHASVSSGYAPPLLSNVITNTGAVVAGLKPERAVQYEMGAEGSWLAGRIDAEVSLFDLENTDKLVTQTVSSVTSTVNAGQQRNRGVEATLAARLVDDPAAAFARVRPWVTWAWTEATFRDFRSDANANASTVDYSGNAVPRVPRNTITAGLDVGMRAGAYLTSTYQHVTRVPVTFDNSTWVRGYDLLGARLGVQRAVARRWTIDAFIGGDNLLGNTVYSFLFVGPNYRGLASAPYGGTGDGYIIPAPYNATMYGNLTVRYVL